MSMHFASSFHLQCDIYKNFLFIYLEAVDFQQHSCIYYTVGVVFRLKSCCCFTLKRKVFKEDLKEVTKAAWWTETGSWFQALHRE